MHSPERIDAVIGLSEMGLTSRQIASVVGIPRETVRKWLQGRLPKYAFKRRRRPGCGCGGRCHAELPDPAYSYLLGLYLGDGHIVRYPRTTRLRIFFDSRHPRLIGECVPDLAGHGVEHRPGGLRARRAPPSGYRLPWPATSIDGGHPATGHILRRASQAHADDARAAGDL